MEYPEAMGDVFRNGGKIPTFGGFISLDDYAKNVAKTAGIQLPNQFNWEGFVGQVEQEAKLNPTELIEVAKSALDRQNELFKENGIRAIDNMSLGTVKYSDLPQSGYAGLGSIDNARRIGESAGHRLGMSNISSYIEVPAQPLVKEIVSFGGRPYSSNAFGPGLKGVEWEKDGVKYFTSLTINDYKKTISSSPLAQPASSLVVN
ncbi:MAG: hypothetical protein HZB36_03420, partial [Candidatus Omnitrophica bacterium]|nr:hypothetical protein [Candidatus Omnitrophota bacterium]